MSELAYPAVSTDTITAAFLTARGILVQPITAISSSKISIGGATPQQVWEYAFRTNTAMSSDLSAAVNHVLDRIDYQRGHHTAAGNVFYVDGYGGSDASLTGSRLAPFKTISRAHTACVSNNHDEIILLPNPNGGPTTIQETATIVLSKNYVLVRGPGRDLLVTQTAGANRDVFSITGNGIELSGFRIATNGSSSNGVTISNAADFVRLYRLWIESAHQDAIQFNVANRCEVSSCFIVGSGRDGVRVSSGAGSGTYNVVVDCVIRDSVGSAVNLQGSDASECRIQRNVIRDNAVGVTISAGTADTVVTDNRFINNTATISDAGTRTLQAWNFLTSGTDGIVSANTVQVSGTTQSARDLGQEIDDAIALVLAD